MAKSRRQKTESRRRRKAERELTQYEASYGSKRGLKKAIKESGLTKTYADAERIMDQIRRGNREALGVIRHLEKPKAVTREETKAYRHKRHVRAEAAHKTNVTKLQKRANEDLNRLWNLPNGKDMKVAAKGRRASKVFEDDVVLLGKQQKGEYVKMIGVVKGQSPKPTGEIPDPNQEFSKMYTMKLWDDTAVGPPGNRRMKRRYRIPNWNHMTTQEKEKAIREEFEYLTRGNGRLKGFFFTDNTFDLE